MKTLTPKATLWLVLILVMVWGINWPLTKLALPDIPPILFSGIRTLLGGLILLLFAMRHRETLRLRQNAWTYLVLAIFNIAGYYGLQTVGLRYLPAGLFSTLVFLQPILLGLFSWLWLGERMFTMKVIGLVLGFGGVIVISSGGMAGHLSVLGIVLGLASGLCWALGTIYMKKKSKQLDSIWAVTMQLIFGGIMLNGIGLTTEKWSDIHWTPSFIGILLFISVFVIAMGWMIYFKLIDNGEAGTVGSYTFMIPVLSTIFSMVILKESLTLTFVVGLVLIAGSVYLVNTALPGKWGNRSSKVHETETCTHESIS
ncbi:EamA family transporter [Paenibacillus terrae]|uniref:EamA family transporter n=1 Tax=Paenibacillus terrae TaxID=159743 RepID=A0A4U2Q3D4_9BACL|nr:DMT family transporter [Paenibacillus terrae]TKH46792.1 EamA family transporter [Paenibacillus terrae]